jgi:hypothetical protein
MFGAAIAATPAPSPAPTATPPIFDTAAPIPYGSPCPGEGRERLQTITYAPRLEIDDASRKAFAADHDTDTLTAFLFTYLDGHNVVLIRLRDHVPPALSLALHAYGDRVPAKPVLGTCPHLGGVFLIMLHVSTGELRMTTVSTDKPGFI